MRLCHKTIKFVVPDVSAGLATYTAADVANATSSPPFPGLRRSCFLTIDGFSNNYMDFSTGKQLNPHSINRKLKRCSAVLLKLSFTNSQVLTKMQLQHAHTHACTETRMHAHIYKHITRPYTHHPTHSNRQGDF